MDRSPRNEIKKTKKPKLTVGLISDTHGLIRPEALAALQGVDTIIHAGDIGSPEVLDALRKIAPVLAIRGNNDRASWAKSLPETRSVKFGSARLFIIHDVKALRFDPAARNYTVVVSGHSHKPSIAARCGVLFVNPGSAGPRRFKLPVALAKLTVAGPTASARILELAI